MFKRKTPSERERERIEQAELLRRSRLATFTEAPGLCQKHPDWQPQVAGKAPPPVSDCPYCRRDGMRNRPTVYDKIEVDHPLNVSPTKMTPSVEKILDCWEEKQRASGKLRPGSDEEESIIFEMDWRREERDESPHRGAQLVSARIVGGEWREWYSVPVRGTNRRKIIEVGPS